MKQDQARKEHEYPCSKQHKEYPSKINVTGSLTEHEALYHLGLIGKNIDSMKDAGYAILDYRYCMILPK